MDTSACEGNGHLSPAACRMVAEFFSVYANPTRISILCALRGGRRTVSELAEHAGVSPQNISQHLRVMRDKGAVRAEREGHHVYCAVADPRFLEGVRMIHDALMDGWRQGPEAVFEQHAAAAAQPEV